VLAFLPTDRSVVPLDAVEPFVIIADRLRGRTMKKWLALGLAVSVFTAGSAFAQGGPTPPANPAPPQTAPQPTTTQPTTTADSGDLERDKIICKKIDVPGTRIGGKKVCKTKREWAEIQRQTAEGVRGAQDAGLRNNPSMGSGN
jgi:hypothetical protein